MGVLRQRQIENDWAIDGLVSDVACGGVDECCHPVRCYSVSFVNVPEDVKLWFYPMLYCRQQFDTANLAHPCDEVTVTKLQPSCFTDKMLPPVIHSSS